jgi:cytochrome c oxidase subunit III
MMLDREYQVKADRSKKMLVWLGVGSIAMFFGAFTSAYIVLQADHFWVMDTLPSMFGISTAIILASSATMYMASKSIKKGEVKGLTLWLAFTLVLGLGFTATQYAGWKQLHSQGKFFVGHISDLKGEYGKDHIIMMQGEPMLYSQGNYYRPDDIAYEKPMNEKLNSTFNVSSSFLFILSGLHIAHLAGGLIYLVVLIYGASAGRYSAENHLGVSLGSIYWHFLDFLWVYLFLFLTFIR